MNKRFDHFMQLAAFWDIKTADKNVKPYHAMLFINLLLKWQAQKNNPVIHITSSEMMDASILGSRTTYFRAMRELQQWGYISKYRKGINGAVVVMKFLQCPAGDRVVSKIPRTIGSGR
jgi:hypothetical protein